MPWRLRAEIERGTESVRRSCGFRPRFFRSPVGLRHPLLGPYLKDAGLEYVSWSIRTRDTLTANSSVLARRILSKAASGDIILLHDHLPAGADVMLEALPGSSMSCGNGDSNSSWPARVRMPAAEHWNLRHANLRSNSGIQRSPLHRQSGGGGQAACCRGRGDRRWLRRRDGGKLPGLPEPLACDRKRIAARPRPCAPASPSRCAQNFTHAITLDGDGQHLPEDIPVMLRVAEETGADLVIGARCFRSRPHASRPLFLEHDWQPVGLGARRLRNLGTARADSGCSGWTNFVGPNCAAGATNWRWKS